MYSAVFTEAIVICQAFLSLISQALAPVSYFQHDLINELIKTEREHVDINNVSVVGMHC